MQEKPELPTEDIYWKAKRYATLCHTSTNHTYDGKPYDYHLDGVTWWASVFIDLVPVERRQNFLAATRVHDVIEDCRQTYNDVAKATNKEVADLAYAVTNEKGKSRKTRANTKFYEEMREVPDACLLKICDRLANFGHSVNTKNIKKIKAAIEENEDFIKEVESRKYERPIATLRQYAKYQFE